MGENNAEYGDRTSENRALQGCAGATFIVLSLELSYFTVALLAMTYVFGSSGFLESSVFSVLFCLFMAMIGEPILGAGLKLFLKLRESKSEPGP